MGPAVQPRDDSRSGASGRRPPHRLRRERQDQRGHAGDEEAAPRPEACRFDVIRAERSESRDARAARAEHFALGPG